jgi:LmbE family N-acetylglucosaminyl deacetylase
MRKTLILFWLSSLHLFSFAQENRLANRQANPAEIYHQLEKLGFLGTALYIAAHPDDENTRMISWLANDRMARTAYLSLTRGDGGQNLIGPELREQLGMIRTQELLEARHIDGGEQFFTRANDFGYSKNPEETLEFWNEEEVLKDVVRVIRQFKPDIIINRFNHRAPGTTHGHHTASAMLSVEAFAKAGRNNSFPTLELEPWQPKRLFFNTSWWFYGGRENFEKADKTNLLEVEIGSYYKHLGYSNNELAALSRSQHKSQGFGSRGSRGAQTEYLEFLDGSFPNDKSDPFSGINTTWTRVKGGSQIQTALNEILSSYNFKNPESSLPELVELRHKISKISNDHWRKIKLTELDHIIQQILGLYLEASTSARQATAGETINVDFEIANRSNQILSFNLPDSKLFLSEETSKVDANSRYNADLQIAINDFTPLTTPYYLKKAGTTGMYAVENPENIGKPELDAALQIPVVLNFRDVTIEYNVPVIHKRTDRVRGEVNEPFNIVPALSVGLNQEVYVFQSGQTQQVAVALQAFKDVSDVTVELELPKGWTAKSKESAELNLENNQQRQVLFDVTAPSDQSVGEITAIAKADGKIFKSEVILIDYDHIPDQQLVRPSTSKIVNPGLINLAKNVAYINGAGDRVAEAIEAMGSKVTRFEPDELPTSLANFDAVVVGIRAFNVEPQAMAAAQPLLDRYVKNGGTLIMQYNTSREIPSDALGPLEITLSRKRVTDETAKVKLLQKAHPALSKPNKITENDFKGWVQERGLYFPDAWAAEFTPLLSMSDPGEDALEGSLLIAEYGKGHVVYTGLSFFRELPAGVPGAYRLMANLLSLGVN